MYDDDTIDDCGPQCCLGTIVLVVIFFISSVLSVRVGDVVIGVLMISVFSIIVIWIVYACCCCCGSSTASRTTSSTASVVRCAVFVFCTKKLHRLSASTALKRHLFVLSTCEEGGATHQLAQLNLQVVIHTSKQGEQALRRT